MQRMKKILIVEDDEATAHAYRSTLQRAGYEVHVAPDGRAGLDYIQTTAPDGVLLDLMMPKVNGTNAYIPSLIREATGMQTETRYAIAKPVVGARSAQRVKLGGLATLSIEAPAQARGT